MKKTLGSYVSHYFKMPRLYRDDLETIERIILEELKPKRYHVACHGFEFDRVAEIESEFKHANVLVIYTHSPCLRLKLARSWAELYSGDNEDMDESIHRIAGILKRCERPWLWMVSKYSVWLAPLVGFGSLAITIGLIALGLLPLKSLYGVIGLLGIASVWWAIGHRFTLHSFSQVDLQASRPR